LGQRELAELAGVHPSTVARIESLGRDETIGSARVVMAILDALRDAGVEVEHDSLRLVPPKKKRK
jgi:transcriptional regulator with XRE-family HTH domain